VAILTHAGQEQVDTAGSLNFGFVLDALGLEVGGIPVEDVDIAGVDVDMGEEVLPHEGVVALGVVSRNANVLVLHGMSELRSLHGGRIGPAYHVEGDDILERDLSMSCVRNN
jgi:hypothetical protein